MADLKNDIIRVFGFNECLSPHTEEHMFQYMEAWDMKLAFSLERFWLCLSGLKKNIYHGFYGLTANKYMESYEKWFCVVEEAIKKSGYRADVFMVIAEDVKQMAVLFSPGEAPRCTPEELAAQINALGQQIYEEEIFKGDTRYCNVTALSNELHGFSGIREGYLQTRRLNDLSFFRMAPEVLTEEKVERLRNGADYRIVMGECRRLEQALDRGDDPVCKKQLDALFLKTVKGAYSWTLLQDALSYCKHMLEVRCTARGVADIDLERLCDPAGYLRIEECVEALWPVLERLCALSREQGPYQDLMLRAIYYIKLHFTEDLSLTDVAAYANVNPNYLSGTFQKEMGRSLREYITSARMERAGELLARGELRVADVAERVGVHDVKYFSRLFKEAVGMTPGEYWLKAQK